MKKKEFLIIFVLAVLVTMLSFGYEYQEPSGCCGVWLGKDIRGLPLSFAFTGPSANEGFAYPSAVRFPGMQVNPVWFSVDVFFWLLFLAAGWWVVRKMKS
jgi:hypothetical protein